MPRARKASQRGPAMRERMLTVALELFTDRGYDATTTREIATRVDVTPAALYYHFESKSECLEALVDPYLETVEAAVDEHGRDGRDGAGFLRRYGEVLTDHLEVARLVDNDAAIGRHPVLGPRVETLTRSLRRTLTGPHPSRADLLRASAALGALRRPLLLLGSKSTDLDLVLEAAVGALSAGPPARRRRPRR